ncbi:hypothetical protein QBE54_01125 [Thermatribacter velox]|uniref:Lipoprotein n=1 Tax=Thermatribacter velox TaxID=3039681 RepID=A0ABZ2YBI1_9BACT|nr:hypothetical protein [Candidatus Atribacteria bacterium]
MAKRILMLATLVFLTFFALGGCSSGNNSQDFPVFEELNFTKGLLFFEQWVHIEGDPGSPYVYIDFPTYRFSEEEGLLISFNQAFGSGEGKINPQVVNLVVGEGTSLSGSAGSGAASGLQGITDFPFRTGYQILSVQEMREDGSLLLRKSSSTITFFDFTFNNPLPNGVFLIRPGEKLEYSVNKDFYFAGAMHRLTLTIQLRCAFIDRANCQNGNWSDA